jgi:ComF family protein
MKGLNHRGKQVRLSNWKAVILNQWREFGRSCLPVSCVLCGGGTAPEGFCVACEHALPELPSARCAVCSLPIKAGSTCGACLRDPPSYDVVNAVYAYTFPIDALIQAYKYRGDLTLAKLLAAPLARQVSTNVDAIVPMPLAAARLQARGFNQAQELARYIGRHLDLPVLAGTCRKVTDTPPQAALPWKERARNVRGAFVCDADFSGMRVAVVDDVMTTGATLNELARNLKRAGAVHVTGWVVARTLR